MNPQQVAVLLAALFVIPALGQSARDTLEKIPDSEKYRTNILKDPKAEETILGPGTEPLTLFVPSNKAMDEHKNATGQVFRRAPSQPGVDRSTYHVATGKLTAPALGAQGLVLTSRNADLQTGKPNDIVTNPGNNATLSLYGGLGTTSRIISGEYQFNRGVIYIVDTVMDVPQRCSETLRFLGYSNFQAALERAGLGAVIDKPNVTVLAYSNEVFTSSTSLGATLQQNIIEGFTGYTPRLAGLDSFPTTGNTTLKISLRGGIYYVNESPIVKSDIICSGGVIHTLGKLLAPDIVPSTSGTAAPAAPLTARMAAVTCALVTAVLYLVL